MISIAYKYCANIQLGIYFPTTLTILESVFFRDDFFTDANSCFEKEVRDRNSMENITKGKSIGGYSYE